MLYIRNLKSISPRKGHVRDWNSEALPIYLVAYSIPPQFIVWVNDTYLRVQTTVLYTVPLVLYVNQVSYYQYLFCKLDWRNKYSIVLLYNLLYFVKTLAAAKKNINELISRPYPLKNVTVTLIYCTLFAPQKINILLVTVGISSLIPISLIRNWTIKLFNRFYY